MKKLLFILSIITVSGTYSLGQNTVTEGGFVYVQVLTQAEYLSIGGNINDIPNVAAAQRKKKDSIRECGHGGGCCWHSVISVDGLGNISSITLNEATDPETQTYQPLEIGLLAYYNSVLDKIIFR